MATVTLCPPSFSPAKPPSGYQSPTITWLKEKWCVTHSTLRMWKNKRNVTITYTPLEPENSQLSTETTDRIDDVVSYQELKKDKVHTVHGVDTLATSSLGTPEARDAWDWKGQGALKLAGPFAKSHWEVLGWGEEEGTGNKWVVTMFAKTLFTPPGIDLYSKDPSGLKEKTVEAIQRALRQIEDGDVRTMAGEMFEIAAMSRGDINTEPARELGALGGSQ